MELKELKKRNRVVITGEKVREFFELDKITEERKQGICEFCDKEGLVYQGRYWRWLVRQAFDTRIRQRKHLSRGEGLFT